ncbi:MAG TPA: DUF349 domain-containing protein [Bacteroidales bacterium]|nr:DUF349 domain-containing protein [Bacteroidales bacterium]
MPEKEFTANPSEEEVNAQITEDALPEEEFFTEDTTDEIITELPPPAIPETEDPIEDQTAALPAEPAVAEITLPEEHSSESILEIPEAEVEAVAEAIAEATLPPVEEAVEETISEIPEAEVGAVAEAIAEATLPPVDEVVEETIAEIPEAEVGAVAEAIVETTLPTVDEVVEETIVAPLVEEANESIETVPDQELIPVPIEPVSVVATEQPEIHPVVEEEETEDEETEVVGEADEESLKGINELSKEQLVELLEETVKDTDVNKIKTTVALIKVAYLRLNKEFKEQHLETFIKGAEEKTELPAVEDPLDQRYEQAFETYKLNKAKHTEEQEQAKLKNLAEKLKILDELKELISSEETLKKTYDHFRALQDKWKEIGMVPKSEVNNLWQNYHFLVEKFFDKVKINKELKDLDLRKNLEAKIKLCEKAEELLLETSILRSFKQLQQYHEEWKEIGPVAQDKKDEIWERFKTATDKINDRRRDHYRKLQEDQQENYNTKLALCEKAEQILAIRNNSLNDWQDTTQEMSDLLKIWRSIGPAGKKMNDKIWERFKTSLDTYFSEKKEYFGKVKDQQIHNYNLKLDLCVQAEALRNNTDWRKTTQDLIQLQKEWKEIGPVPRKHANRIWKRFRAACDEFFTRKANYFASIQKQEEDNLQAKLDLIKQVQEYELTGNKNEDLQMIKEMQRQWMEIGHVPMKDKDKLQNDFRTAINKHLDKLKVDAMEISTLSFKAHYESVRDVPDANRILSKERGTLINKLSKLKEDISLWENNIGFLADSKNAQILKKEFEKKIDNAKKELSILEAKIRILNGPRS